MTSKPDSDRPHAMRSLLRMNVALLVLVLIGATAMAAHLQQQRMQAVRSEQQARAEQQRAQAVLYAEQVRQSDSQLKTTATARDEELDRFRRENETLRKRIEELEKQLRAGAPNPVAPPPVQSPGA